MSCKLIVCHHYRVYGTLKTDEVLPIFYGTDIQNGYSVVLKTEDVDSRFSFNGYTGSRMFYEGKVFQALQGGPGIPSMHWCGQDNDFNFLIMERLGDNLQQLLEKCAGKFSLKTVLVVAHRTLYILEYVHFKGLLHRAVCPQNFAVGFGKKSAQIFLMDFSTTLRYRLIKNNQHFQYGYKGFNRNNLHFSSWNVNKGYDGSRRDDLQSWLYMIVYLFTGALPWIGLEMFHYYTLYNKVVEMKRAITSEQLCERLPKGFQQLAAHISSLQFTYRPAYSFMKNLLKDMLQQIGEQLYPVYDWMLKVPFRANPQNLVECLTMRLPVIPNEEAFLAEQFKLYEKEQAEKENIENILKPPAELSIADATNLPLRDELKHPKYCSLF